ncbi:MAG: bifunctional glutamate N-acetyltransferase/amino-acid acetyltransferase ArgJ [Lentisphaeria bacterium]|nr:bifunctional glutamate N-acetyltransferase/amino-acid acetyltransferase ArgJ [Lentisphaeria bacterium]
MNMDFVENGGVVSPAGFQAAGIACGLKRNKAADLALLKSDCPCNFAGTFTTNLFPAAPVQLCKERVLNQKTVRAVVVNSGVANACVGLGGYDDAVKMCEITARELGVAPEEVMVSSTGRIGNRLPMDIIEKGIGMAAKELSYEGGAAAARAIMTTDTRPKELAVSFLVDGKKVTIGGMCKGAGMIAPLMAVPHATMLCYITTDAEVSNETLSAMLGESVSESFNRVNVDGDMSTNDTVLILANGASGVKIEAGTSAAESFRSALDIVTVTLARAIAMDGEGATKFVSVEVAGAANDKEAEYCARTIANSMLCKTAWFGCDPNWGRVLAAAGRSGAAFSPENVSLDYDDMPVVRNGVDAGTPESELCEVMNRNEFTIHLNLGEGNGTFTVWTCDISHEYVTINADYHT